LEDSEMLALRKLFLLSVAGVLCLAAPGQAANLIVNGDFATNPAPAGHGAVHTWLHGHVSSISYNTVDSNDHTQDTWVSTDGYKILSTDAAGMEMLGRDPAALTLPSNGHLFYQYVPVTAGRAYYVRGLWKGDLTAGANGAGKSWAEAYVGFASIPAGSEPNVNTDYVAWPGALRYRKVWDAAALNYQNISPTGTWAWEDITASPNGTPPAYYVPQTGQNYMVVAFLLGGNALTGNSPSAPYMYVDNVTAIECAQWLTGDMNQDCMVTFTDLALMHNTWLDCNLDPVTSCP
jgi:hypothetical protein